MKRIDINYLYKLIINCCFAVATLAAGAASYWGGYQQKEPEDIQNIIRRRKK